MLRRSLLRSVTAIPLLRWLNWPPRRVFASGDLNAAAIYRDAFRWSERLSADDSALLRKAATVSLEDPRAVALIQQARPVFDAIRKAARVGRCNWGPEPITDGSLGKGHLDASNLNIIRVACVSARRHAKRGERGEALDELFAGLTLAHRIGSGGFLFARVLECGGEIAALETLGRILPQLDRAGLDELSRRLELLPAPEPASAAIGPESRFIVSSLRTKLLAIGPVIDAGQWGELGFDDVQAAALKKLTGGDRAKLLAHLDATGPSFAELARRLDLPRPSCRAELDEYFRAKTTTYPLVAALVEPAWGVRQAIDRVRAFRAMASAGVILVRDGEPAFRAERDPFGEGPFHLDQHGAGYLIRSALGDDRKPVASLAVGEPG
jgi:hypothetical protein